MKTTRANHERLVCQHRGFEECGVISIFAAAREYKIAWCPAGGEEVCVDPVKCVDCLLVGEATFVYYGFDAVPRSQQSR